MVRGFESFAFRTDRDLAEDCVYVGTGGEGGIAAAVLAAGPSGPALRRRPKSLQAILSNPLVHGSWVRILRVSHRPRSGRGLRLCWDWRRGWDCCGRPGRRPFGPGAEAPSKIAPGDFVEPACSWFVGSNPSRFAQTAIWPRIAFMLGLAERVGLLRPSWPQALRARR